MPITIESSATNKSFSTQSEAPSSSNRRNLTSLVKNCFMGMGCVRTPDPLLDPPPDHLYDQLVTAIPDCQNLIPIIISYLGREDVVDITSHSKVSLHFLNTLSRELQAAQKALPDNTRQVLAHPKALPENTRWVFAPLLSQIQTTLLEHRHHPKSAAQLAARVQDIIAPLINDVSQLSRQEVTDALSRLPRPHQDTIKSWLQTNPSKHDKPEADQKEHESVIPLPPLDAICDPKLLASLWYLRFADRKIAESFDSCDGEFLNRQHRGWHDHVNDRYDFTYLRVHRNGLVPLDRLSTAMILGFKRMAPTAKWMQFSDNRLTTIAIFQFDNLRRLTISENHCRSLQGIRKLRNLESLTADENDLTDTDLSELGDLKRLTELRLCHNKIKKLHPSMVKLQGLTRLHLNFNLLESESLHVICELRQLTFLDLENNRLTSLLPTLANLNRLVTLRLQGNNLEPPPKIELKKVECLTADNLQLIRSALRLPKLKSTL